jgi:hypothetical protein
MISMTKDRDVEIGYLLYLEAVVSIVLYRLAIETIPFGWLVRNMEGGEPSGCEECTVGDSIEKDTIYRVSGAVSAISNRFPPISTCLAESLTASRMLGRRGYDGCVVMGVRKDGEKMSAHSWSICKGVVVTGGEQMGRYRAVAIFSWRGR